MKKIPYVLVVIDMQPGFMNTVKPVIDPCLKLIEQAKQDNAYILFVEYDLNYCKNTVEPLQTAVVGYKRHAMVEKSSDDGGHVVYDWLKKHRLHNKAIHVCGVNIEYCVHDTVLTLNELGVDDITLQLDGCNGRWQMREHPNHEEGYENALNDYLDIGVRFTGELKHFNAEKYEQNPWSCMFA